MLLHEKHQAETILKKLTTLDPKKHQNIMNALTRIQQEGIKLGEQRGKQEGIKLGEQRGKQEGKQTTLLALIEKGLISKQIAEQMLKEDL